MPDSPIPAPSRLSDAPAISRELDLLSGKLARGERLTFDDGLFLYERAPLDWLQARATEARRERHGEEAYFNRNIHFEPTNVCVYACKFCAFYRPPKVEGVEGSGAWAYTFEDLREKLSRYPVGSLTEIHVTGGVHPDRGVEYGEALCAFIRELRPEIHIKAFTAVELAYFARKSGIELPEALRRLKRAGLDSIPGGGAEIFDPEVRKRIAGGKAPALVWLEVHEQAHREGLLSNATMLYGHVEEFRHRLDHMARLRELQDRTGGFKSFIPLRYRNDANALSHLPEVSAEDDLRNYAVARLFLDNIPHLKAYWAMLGLELATEALDYGVDDLDGTVDDTTRIYSMAGGPAHPVASAELLRNAIRSKGRVPVERDSGYAKLGGSPS
jgi:aminodeoxyfutalosine synthase